jgi:hypothetical protein
MTKSPRHSQSSEGEDNDFAVSDAEVEAWAERERRRRAEWAEGPTEEEKRAYARRVRWQRGGSGRDHRKDVYEGRRVVHRLRRDTALAMIGLGALLAEAPYQLIGGALRAGREWEDEFYAPPRQRKRVALDEED